MVGRCRECAGEASSPMPRSLTSIPSTRVTRSPGCSKISSRLIPPGAETSPLDRLAHSPQERTPRPPCSHCEELLCEAGKCIKILLCDRKNNPIPPDCEE